MTIKRALFLLTFAVFTLSPAVVKAIFDPLTLPNNKAGIHILETSELAPAAKLVNEGGDWGYVTIPIQPKDRDKDKWIDFMRKAYELHLIPILRITTIPEGGTWGEPEDTDLVDFANFLAELPWPVENRYIVIFNEVNRGEEWGGKVSPATYAKILKNAYSIFKERSPDFFILPAGLDNALGNSSTSMSSDRYLREMKRAVPEVWDHIDGWTSHAYPNPAFSASPYKTGWQSITSYHQELSAIGKKLPVFITETGWDQTKLSLSVLMSYYKTAWRIWTKDDAVVAVTPFLLSAQAGDFVKFSFLGEGNVPNVPWTVLEKMEKVRGEPKLTTGASPSPTPGSFYSGLASIPSFNPLEKLLVLENLIRKLLALPEKKIAEFGDVELTVEISKTADQIEKGLSGRARLGETSGMLFVFSPPEIPAFWMKDMRFDLDLIWIKDGVVVEITPQVKKEGMSPRTIYRPSIPVDMVLEVNAGFSEKYGINPGDRITLK